MDRLGHLPSYTNKTNDADELGFTLLNTLINQVIPKAMGENTSETKLVLIGHSLGARILSRALYSQDYLKHAEGDTKLPPKTVDLFIGLQAAFTINRFNKKVKANPTYKNVFRKLPILLTSSHKDSSNNNSKMLGVKNAGSGHGLVEAKKDKSVFCTAIWSPSKKEALKNECEKEFKNKVIVLDVSPILDGCFTNDCTFKVDSHNDVFDMDMGYVINYALDKMID